ncbi:hypothetical protein L596_015916 [Steinernema carpocapsae]|uniref:Uncharacterized protein n=1 Tax=Steinernema carpocapsae TaxID=34508 RepID=A0A4U5NGJ3_STECR|nr:hypothetical protein L596_015916 [Steinernema carpocapsae]
MLQAVVIFLFFSFLCSPAFQESDPAQHSNAPCKPVSWSHRRKSGISPSDWTTKVNLTFLYALEDKPIADSLVCILKPFFKLKPILGFFVEAVNATDSCDKLHEKTAKFGALNLALLVSSSLQKHCRGPKERRKGKMNIVQIFKMHTLQGDLWKAYVEGVRTDLKIRLEGSPEGLPRFTDLEMLMKMAMAMWTPRFGSSERTYKTLEVHEQQIVTDKFIWTTGVIVGICAAGVVLLLLLAVTGWVIQWKIAQKRAKERLIREAMNRDPGYRMPLDVEEDSVTSGESGDEVKEDPGEMA